MLTHFFDGFLQLYIFCGHFFFLLLANSAHDVRHSDRFEKASFFRSTHGDLYLPSLKRFYGRLQCLCFFCPCLCLPFLCFLVRSYFFSSRLFCESVRYEKILRIAVGNVLDSASLPYPADIFQKNNFHPRILLESASYCKNVLYYNIPIS